MVLGYKVDAKGNATRAEMRPFRVRSTASGEEVRFEGDGLYKYAHAGGFIELDRGGKAMIVMVDREKNFAIARADRVVDAGETGVIWVETI